MIQWNRKAQGMHVGFDSDDPKILATIDYLGYEYRWTVRIRGVLRAGQCRTVTECKAAVEDWIGAQ